MYIFTAWMGAGCGVSGSRGVGAGCGGVSGAGAWVFVGVCTRELAPGPPGLGMARTWRDGVWQLGLALRLARLLLLLLLHLPLLVEDLLGLAVAD